MDEQRFRQFTDVLESAGERAALAYLSSLSSFRYLSVIYYSDGQGHPVHHYDRLNPDLIEAEQVDQNSTYCNNVLTEREPFATSDSVADPRLNGHPARELIRSYFGLPLFDHNGAAHAVLCHYDHFPQDTAGLDHALLRQAAKSLEARLARYGIERPVSTVETVYSEQIGNATFHVMKRTKAEWAQPRYSVERTRTRADGSVSARVTYGQSTAFGHGGFSSVEEATEFAREWCEPS